MPKTHFGTIEENGYTETPADWQKLPEIDFMKPGAALGSWGYADYDITVSTGDMSFDVYTLPKSIGMLIEYAKEIGRREMRSEMQNAFRKIKDLIED